MSYELGRKNWIDSVAGEAVVLGAKMREPTLEIAGTELARMIREIPYDSDRFAWVMASARGLMSEIDRIIKKRKDTTYIDAVFKGETLAKRDDQSWEYNLIYSYGKYEIQMILPVYQGREVLREDKKKKAESIVCGFYKDPTFEMYEKSIIETDHVSQMYKTITFTDRSCGRLLRMITDHDHEGSNYRGWYEIFYFYDFDTAWSAWEKMKPGVEYKK